MELQKLTLHHYGETTADDRRMTLSPSMITVVAVQVDDTVVNGRTLRGLTVLFVDGGSIDLTVNHSDLEMLEAAVGSFGFG